MARHTSAHTVMKLVFFDLPSVIQYDNIALRNCLIRAIKSVLDTPVISDDIDWNANCSGVVLDLFSKSRGQLPTNLEFDRIKNLFLDYVKEYFLSDEECFEVWPGVQNVMGSIQKKEGWEMHIVSDYWCEASRFMLESCGVFSREISLCCAEEALSAADGIQRIINSQTHNPEVSYLVYSSLNSTAQRIDLPENILVRINHLDVAPKGFLDYPDFEKLFILSE